MPRETQILEPIVPLLPLRPPSILLLSLVLLSWMLPITNIQENIKSLETCRATLLSRLIYSTWRSSSSSHLIVWLPGFAVAFPKLPGACVCLCISLPLGLLGNGDISPNITHSNPLPSPDARHTSVAMCDPWSAVMPERRFGNGLQHGAKDFSPEYK